MSDELQSAGTTPNTGDATTAATQAQATETPAAQPAEGVQVANEGQSSEGQQAEKATPEAEAQPEKVVPEKYEFKAPEGAQYDDGVLDEFSAVAKELGLSQDDAQKVVERMGVKMAQRATERQQAAFEEYRNNLAEQTRNDKEIGGEKLDENLAVARKALDAFGTPELRTFLEESGMGNHPELIRAFVRAGKAISEDKFVAGATTPSKGERDAATVLYGNNQS